MTMIKAFDYILVRGGVRHAELKRSRGRSVVYAFCALSVLASAVLCGMVILNLAA